MRWFKVRLSKQKPEADLSREWMIVYRRGQEYGPFSAPELVSLVKHKSLADQVLICRADRPGDLQHLDALLPSLEASLAAERRTGLPRTFCNAEATIYTDNNKIVRGTCIDIAPGGVFLEVEAGKLRPGHEVRVILRSPAFLSPVAEEARIIRRIAGAGYALEFLHASDSTSLTIESYIANAALLMEAGASIASVG